METERGPMSRSCHVAAVAGVVAGAGEPDPAAARLPNHTVCGRSSGCVSDGPSILDPCIKMIFVVLEH
jgi:hypothetical protein